MEGAATVLLGVIIGLVGALPSMYLLEQALKRDRRVSVASGLVSIMASFAMLSAAIFVVWLVSRERVLVFGVAVVASFLFVWTIEAWRAWHDAQKTSYREKGNRSESAGCTR